MIESKIKDINYLIQSNSLDKAKKIINELFTTNPENYDLINLMGLVEAKKGNYAIAINNFEKEIIIFAQKLSKFEI